MPVVAESARRTSPVSTGRPPSDWILAPVGFGRGEFTDAVMMRAYDRLASQFTHDGAVRIPDINTEAVGREEIRAGIERLQGLWN